MALKLVSESRAVEVSTTESVRAFTQKVKNSHHEFMELHNLGQVLQRDNSAAFETLRQAHVVYRQKQKRFGLEAKLGIDPIEFNPTGDVTKKTHRIFRVARDGEQRIPFKVHPIHEAPPNDVVWGTYDAATNRIKVPVGDAVVVLGETGLETSVKQQA